ncbi:hypothetical protein PN499_01175 [Kamptonema animale CS-326]|jgi:hypothetical protein|uniref:hypothetical protein n=1 Tax=Kamptonema animale TaxID=92934 RepID=UPI002330F316|nr:hypothetical protein [Kamptonema animale]MDB9509816.1 hypothetical protein [Kamptonema animale CS-326]
MFPYEKFTINTSLHPEIVRQKLLAVVEPRKAIRWKINNYEKPYEGEVGDHSFEINRIINYRNSFSPIIKGRIYPEGMGSKIDIKMAMHPSVIVFMSIWLGLVGSSWILSAIAMIEEGKFDSSIFGVSGMLLGCLLLPLIGFKPEANDSKKFLIDLLYISRN